MTLILRWRQPPSKIELRWRGPTGAMLDALARNPSTPIASVIGLPGRDGGDVVDGDRGDVRIQNGLWLIDDIDGGTFN